MVMIILRAYASLLRRLMQLIGYSDVDIACYLASRNGRGRSAKLVGHLEVHVLEASINDMVPAGACGGIAVRTTSRSQEGEVPGTIELVDVLVVILAVLHDPYTD